MHLLPGEEDARAGLDRRVRCSGPETPLALQDAEHLFVFVVVVGRTAGRNTPNELRDLRAAHRRVDEHTVPPVRRRLRRAIGESNEGRRARPGWGRRVQARRDRGADRRRSDWDVGAGIGATRADHGEGLRAGLVHLDCERHPGPQIDARLRTNRVGLAVEQNDALAGEDEQYLVARHVGERGRQAGSELEDTERDRRGAGRPAYVQEDPQRSAPLRRSLAKPAYPTTTVQQDGHRPSGETGLVERDYPLRPGREEVDSPHDAAARGRPPAVPTRVLPLVP